MASLGIDFGTSRCRAFAGAGSASTRIQDADGAPSIPSLVACSPKGDVVVGAGVWRATETPRIQLVQGILRVLGRRYYSREIEWVRHSSSYDIVPSPNGDAWVRVAGLEFSPEELVAEIIKYIRRRAFSAVGERIERAVIAVPTMFDQLQRRAMLEACDLAQLPATLVGSASAVSLSLSSRNAQRIVLLDVGGGYFDASLLTRQDDRWVVTANSGDGLLGGMDFDRRLVDLVDGEQAELGKVDIERLCLRAERVRHALSDGEQVTVAAVLGDSGSEATPATISRTQHDEAVHDELAALANPCGWMLDDVGLGTDDVDEVVLLGGMARVPGVQEEVLDLFLKQPLTPGDGDELIARGALRICQGHDVSQLSAKMVGVKVRGGAVSPVVPRASEVPYRNEMKFAAPRADQERIVFEVYEGDAQLANDNLYLGTFVLTDLQQGVQPALAFELDESGVFGVQGGEFSWAGGDKVLPLREPSAVWDLDELSEAAPGSYVRLEDDDTMMRKDASGIRESTRPAPSGPPPRTLAPPRPDGSPSRHAPSSIPPPPSGDALVGTMVGGRYLIEAVIAEGGMGRVYRAVHETLGRTFAVKVLHPELAANDDLAGRFLREAQSAARIDSDHVVDIVDFGRLPDGTGYFVMEYLEGGTLRELVDERGALPVELCRDIGMQIADGASAAHEIGVVHRDLKPDNVVIVKRRNRPYFCKVLDFGIAKHSTTHDEEDGPVTLAGTIVGSPYYMSPEQIIGGSITPQTDIYAIGVVLYEMIAGTPPFNAESVAHLLQQHMDIDPPPFMETCDHIVPAALEKVIIQCMAKSPSERVKTASELHKRLAEAI